MAGHSKWANIKRQKARVDAKKGQTFTQLSRAIIVATRNGVPDPAGNFQLQPREVYLLMHLWSLRDLCIIATS